jgi:hypothetical protein
MLLKNGLLRCPKTANRWPHPSLHQSANIHQLIELVGSEFSAGQVLMPLIRFKSYALISCQPASAMRPPQV